MTLEELTAEVRKNVDIQERVLSDSRIHDAINHVVRKIAKLHTFEEMRTTYTANTITGQRRYSFPTRTKDCYSLRIHDGSAGSRKLIFTPARYHDQYFPNPDEETQAKPERYVRFDKEFELYPVPDSSYKMVMRISQYPHKADRDGDEIDLYDKNLLIIYWTTSYLCGAEREFELAQWWKQQGDEQFKIEVNNDHTHPDWDAVPHGFGHDPGVWGVDHNDPFECV